MTARTPEDVLAALAAHRAVPVLVLDDAARPWPART